MLLIWLLVIMGIQEIHLSPAFRMSGAHEQKKKAPKLAAPRIHRMYADLNSIFFS